MNRQIALPWTTVITRNSADVDFLPSTPWMSTQGIARFRAVSEIREANGDITVQVGYQTANDYTEPDSTSHGLASTHSSEGFNFPADYDDPATDLKGKQFVRFGWRVGLSTGTDTAWARVAGSVQVVTE